RTAELQGLMAKAETGVGGAVVAEVAYRNEYIATRGQAKLAEQAWQKSRCRETVPGAAMPVAPPPAAAPPSRAGRSVYWRFAKPARRRPTPAATASPCRRARG